MRSIGLATLVALTSPGPAMAEPPGIPERKVELPADNGLIVGHRARQGRAVLVELVPAGESVQRYTRMVSLQTLPDRGGKLGQDLLGRFAELYRARCPRSSVTPLPPASAPVGVRIDCPLHPATGKTETVFARALDLGRDGAIVHITMTFLPMPADSGWARDYLARVAVR